MNKIFADTSGWLVIVVKSDALHEKAVEMYLQLLASNRNFVVHEAIRSKWATVYRTPAQETSPSN